MYGTVARVKVKRGMEEKFIEIGRSQEMRSIPGLVAEAVYKLDKGDNEYIIVVGFESKEAYVRNAQSPEQDKRYREFRETLDADPEWNDGEIVDAYRRPS